MRGRGWLESQGLSVHKPFALAAAILLLFAVACIPTTPESHIRITDAHCQSEDLRQAFGIEYRHVRIVAPMILPGNSSGLRDSYGTYWSADVRFGELQSEIGCLTRIYDSADNAHRALEDLMEVRFKISGIESQPPELIEETRSIFLQSAMSLWHSGQRLAVTMATQETFPLNHLGTTLRPRSCFDVKP